MKVIFKTTKPLSSIYYHFDALNSVVLDGEKYGLYGEISSKNLNKFLKDIQPSMYVKQFRNKISKYVRVDDKYVTLTDRIKVLFLTNMDEITI